MPRFISAIKDVHSNPAGRMLAKCLLESQDIKVFFMEWSKPVGQDLAECFKGLHPNDAEPTLRQLAEICTSRRIDIIPSDLDVATTVQLLNSNTNDPYAGTYKDGSAVQPWGKAVRDRHAAGVVGQYMNAHPEA